MSTARRAAWVMIAMAVLAVAVGRAGALPSDLTGYPGRHVLAQSASVEPSSPAADPSAGRNHFPQSGAVLLLLIVATIGLRRGRWHWRES